MGNTVTPTFILDTNLNLKIGKPGEPRVTNLGDSEGFVSNFVGMAFDRTPDPFLSVNMGNTFTEG